MGQQGIEERVQKKNGVYDSLVLEANHLNLELLQLAT